MKNTDTMNEQTLRQSVYPEDLSKGDIVAPWAGMAPDHFRTVKKVQHYVDVSVIWWVEGNHSVITRGTTVDRVVR